VALGASLVLLGWAIHRWRLSIIAARHAAVLEERARLARDVHDTIVQDLLSVWMRLEALRRVGAAWPVEVTRPLDVLRGSVHAGLDEARRLLAELRSGERGSLDLASALAEVAHRLAEGTGTRVRIETRGADGSPPPPGEVTRALLRIGQEAVANALRHSGAREILVAVEIDPRRVRLVIRDDGRGFDARGAAAAGAAAAPETAGHFGLVGMRERARGLGGQVTIESDHGRGTTVRVDIPRGEP
jgi:signal transduction histidine kinase